MTKQTRTQNAASAKKAKAGNRLAARVLVLHGPNLNLLGSREPGVYGHATLADINAALKAQGQAAGVAVDCFQSNHEGDLIDRVQAAPAENVGFIVINPAGYTHSSVALRDALAAAHGAARLNRLDLIEVAADLCHGQRPAARSSSASNQRSGSTARTVAIARARGPTR